MYLGHWGAQLNRLLLCIGIGLLLSNVSFAFTDINWEREFPIPLEGRWNPYELPKDEFYDAYHLGSIYSSQWPVEITGILLPTRPIYKFMERKDDNAFRKVLREVFSQISDYDSMEDVWDWMGLNPYPKAIGDIDSPYYTPNPPKISRKTRMGFSLIERNNARGFTFSCSACHSSQLFGKTVVGLANRFVRANEIFVKGKKAAQIAPNWLFHVGTDATPEEREMFREMKENIEAVGVKTPVVLGLDTSLAQVSLSLARRNKDAYATKNKQLEKKPRREALSAFVADSKPMNWWALKYKNRWLSDGSVVSGNPILTNILWNEIGRGTDLHQLEDWIDNNFKAIQALTTKTFASTPPSIQDFFEFSIEDLEAAKRGEVHFENTCAKCHGSYMKLWNAPWANILPLSEQIKTVQVDYPQPTKVKNVGTDPNRWMGMKSLEQLNELSISKRFGIKIEAQEGYVPPPLVGIWARWPYLHNNSIPNLCQLLTPANQRVMGFWMGEAISKTRDFDFDCNGYPLGNKTPQKWKKNSDYYYSTNNDGMRNSGHSKMLMNEDGSEKFSAQDKYELIKFLQSL